MGRGDDALSPDAERRPERIYAPLAAPKAREVAEGLMGLLRYHFRRLRFAKGRFWIRPDGSTPWRPLDRRTVVASIYTFDGIEVMTPHGLRALQMTPGAAHAVGAIAAAMLSKVEV